MVPSQAKDRGVRKESVLALRASLLFEFWFEMSSNWPRTTSAAIPLAVGTWL